MPISHVTKQIRQLYFMLITSYIIRTVFLAFSGNFVKIIESSSVRLELEFCFWPLLDCLAIIPILVMH